MRFYLKNFRIDTFADRVEVSRGDKVSTISIGRRDVELHQFGDSNADMNAMDRHTYTIWIDDGIGSIPFQYSFSIWCDNRGFTGQDSWKAEMAVNLLSNINYMEEFKSFKSDEDYTSFGESFGYDKLGQAIAAIRKIKNVSEALGFKIQRYEDVAFVNSEGISKKVYNMLVEDKLEFE